MASIIYNIAGANFAKATCDWDDNATTTIKVALVRDTYTPDKDHTSMNDITAATSKELNVTNYAPGPGGAGRKSLANRTATADNSNDRAALDADDLAGGTKWAALGTGQTIKYAVIYKHVDNAVDANNPLIACVELDASGIPTNGGDFEIVWNASGIIFLTPA